MPTTDRSSVDIYGREAKVPERQSSARPHSTSSSRAGYRKIPQAGSLGSAMEHQAFIHSGILRLCISSPEFSGDFSVIPRVRQVPRGAAGKESGVNLDKLDCDTETALISPIY
jgi:hypothetical protein